MCGNASSDSLAEEDGVRKNTDETSADLAGTPEELAAGRAPLVRRMIGFYQEYLSGLKMAPSCRFEPTCSNYALTALARHGVVKGLLLSIGRLLRCAPWHPGGWDPVPPVKKWSTGSSS